MKTRYGSVFFSASLFIVMSIMLHAQIAFAENLCVGSGRDYATIQSAVDAASEGM